VKIYFNTKVVSGPWGGGNKFLQSLNDFVGSSSDFDLVYSLDDFPDIIFIMDLNSMDYGFDLNDIVNYVGANPEVYVVHRINECDARKKTNHVDDLIKRFNSWVDLTLFVSSWMCDYFENQNLIPNKRLILYNGVDREHFKSSNKIKNGKLNIVTHHWSDNIMKGFDVYQEIDRWVGFDDDITFTYIGRERGIFKNTKIIPPLHGKSLGDELGKYDVYVSGSRFDPGPNHILEALSCELPIFVHEDGGGAVEFSGKSSVYKDLDTLYDMIINKPINLNHDSISLRSWESCASQFFDITKDLVDE
jgi:glycosyltransferase involved in cell wall biosynthesis